jgi:tetratricopeptide (TPR) repeat protein
MNAASVNLLWQHRFRGLLSVAHHSVAEDGRVLLIKPDDFEHRTYQLLDVQATGEVTELGAISVETVYKFDGLPGGRLVLGMTSDDIYIFRDGRKARFMPDRRVTYTDVHVAPVNGWFACSFSDPIFSVHGIAMGDANARLGWTRDLNSTPNRVAITSDGRVVVAGMQDGRLLAMDHLRAPLWECHQNEPITAVSLPDTGPRPVAGTALGTVMALDEDGGFRWRTPTGGTVLDVDTDSDARWAAALVSHEGLHRVMCFGPDGAPVWEYDLEHQPNGVALSPNGRFLLISCVNGTVSLFGVDFTRAAPRVGGRRDFDFQTAQAAAAAGDLTAAREILSRLLEETPHDLPIARELGAVDAGLCERLRAEARAHAEEGRPLDALRVLDAAQEYFPWDAELFAERLTYRESAIRACEEQARSLEASGELEAASHAWLQLLRLDPHNLSTRESLHRNRLLQAERLRQAGDAHQQRGDLDSAVACWQQALELDDSEAIRERLRQAEVNRCLAAGIAYYEAQRLPEAAFQLRKVLALDPDNIQARRYLGYTQGLTGDNLIADRFARLE